MVNCFSGNVVWQQLNILRTWPFLLSAVWSWLPMPRFFYHLAIGSGVGRRGADISGTTLPIKFSAVFQSKTFSVKFLKISPSHSEMP